MATRSVQFVTTCSAEAGARILGAAFVPWLGAGRQGSDYKGRRPGGDHTWPHGCSGFPRQHWIGLPFHCGQLLRHLQWAWGPSKVAMQIRRMAQQAALSGHLGC